MAKDISDCRKLAKKIQHEAGLGGSGDLLIIMQEIEIWPYY